MESLNEPQRLGVESTEGPCMVIAGAGSGKTRVLTIRIAHLIRAKGVDPFHILALTFTNKAASEMRSRIEDVVGPEARNLWMGTFHSVFARILRYEAERLGYPGNFSIYDTDDSKTLIRQIIKEQKLDDKVYKPNVVLNRISGAKNRLISWQEYINNPVFLQDDESAMKPQMGKLYKIYCERCFKASAMDFDDLLFNTNVLFRDNPDVLNKYQHRFKYVLVDEFQDTNLSQYLITKKLSNVHQNICVVGDDAQSIYAFRGADIRNILNFEKDYEDLRIIKLEQNYRSTKVIVNAANAVINNNKAQLKKEVWTANDDGELIELIKANSDNEEGKLVATSIFEEKLNQQVKNREIAVLYRTNAQSRAIEEALRRANIKYKIIGGLSFYQRKEIKDILSYLRFVVNQNDEQALRRIINLPKRGIGPGTVDKIIVAADEHSINLWQVVSNVFQFIPGRITTAVDQFATMIKSFIAVVQKKDAYEAASYIAKQSGLLRELYEDKTIEGLSRYENVQELLNAIKEFVDNVHKIGMKFILWYSVPYIGERSKNYQRFKGKYLNYWGGRWGGSYTLDPRYPDVREFLIKTYVNAVKDWNIDGFKLDFIDSFHAREDTELTIDDGRDFSSVNEAVDRLMTDISLKLKEIKPDILIEFRQSYIGPLMRKYGNMFRAGDCPNSYHYNRVRITDLRLLSGNTAVHSDMLMWHPKDPVESAALQLHNTLFSVPQISVMLDKIPDDHLEMVKFWNTYWLKNRSVLLEGDFIPTNPDFNYTQLSSSDQEKQIIAVYVNEIVRPGNGMKKIDIINAKLNNSLIIDFPKELKNKQYKIYNCLGKVIDKGFVQSGLQEMNVPAAGFIQIED